MDAMPRVTFEFEVDRILSISADGRYQVQWAPAWVSKFHLVGCEHLIQEYIQQQQQQQQQQTIDEAILEPNAQITCGTLKIEDGEHAEQKFTREDVDETTEEVNDFSDDREAVRNDSRIFSNEADKQSLLKPLLFPIKLEVEI